MISNKVKKLLASVSALLAMNSVSAATVQTCTLDYQGVVNAVDIDDGIVTGFVKLFAKESRGESFTLVAENGEELERTGTITTAVDLTDFTNDGLTCSFDNRFTPLHSIDEDSPWRQFQMRFDSFYDSNILATYQHNGLNTKIMVANGWTWGTSMAGIHVFEYEGRDFTPVKFDIDQGNGELPAYRAGDTAMSLSGDGGQWQYRASAVSDDGRIVAGYARLEESVNFDQGSVIDESLKFGMVWQLAESCNIDSTKCAGENASRLTSGSADTPTIQVQSLSAPQITRNNAESAQIPDSPNNFKMLSYEADNTMESVFGITTIESGKYLLNGRSASGKAMVAMVTLAEVSGRNARIATLQNFEQAMRLAADQVNVIAVQENKTDCELDPTVEMDGKTVTLRCGYPCPHPSGISQVVNADDGFEYRGGNCAGRLGNIELRAEHAPEPANCKIKYAASRGDGPPRFSTFTEGC